MTATPLFIYCASTAHAPVRRPIPQRLSLRTRSTPGRLRHVKTRMARHVKTRMAIGFRRGR
jgi:hypothetical protein